MTIEGAPPSTPRLPEDDYTKFREATTKASRTAIEEGRKWTALPSDAEVKTTAQHVQTTIQDVLRRAPDLGPSGTRVREEDFEETLLYSKAHLEGKEVRVYHSDSTPAFYRFTHWVRNMLNGSVIYVDAKKLESEGEKVLMLQVLTATQKSTVANLQLLTEKLKTVCVVPDSEEAVFVSKWATKETLNKTAFGPTPVLTRQALSVKIGDEEITIEADADWTKGFSACSSKRPDEKKDFADVDKVVNYLKARNDVLFAGAAKTAAESDHQEMQDMINEIDGRFGLGEGDKFSKETEASVREKLAQIDDLATTEVAYWPMRDGETRHLFVKVGKDVRDYVFEFSRDENKVFLVGDGDKAEVEAIHQMRTKALLRNCLRSLYPGNKNLDTAMLLAPTQINEALKQKAMAPKDWKKKAMAELDHLHRGRSILGVGGSFFSEQPRFGRDLSTIADRIQGGVGHIEHIVDPGSPDYFTVDIKYCGGRFGAERKREIRLELDTNTKRLVCTETVEGKKVKRYYRSVNDFVEEELEGVKTAGEARAELARKRRENWWKLRG
jgi:hypothetical protein